MRMDVWIEGRVAPVGVLIRSKDKALSFAYADDAGPDHLLSLSLPIQKRVFSDADCRGYFANLLFEGPGLERALDSYRLDRDDIGGLLWHLGADCPGAISITPEGSGPAKTPGRFPEDYEEIEEQALHQILLSLHLHKRLPVETRDPSPVAGVQGKIAVVAQDGHFYLPKTGSRAPTTHILKVSPADDPLITRHEGALLRIAEACGIEVAPCETLAFDVEGRQIQTLCSTRFDRTISLSAGEGAIGRIHVEDFCQALGLPPSLKYERSSANPAHRFSAAAVARIARQASVPALFQREFLQHTLFNLMVGNTDNHGKNASVIHRNGGTRLAPLYDTVPVFMDRRVTHELAFLHGTARFAEDFTQEALKGLLVDLGFSSPRIGTLLRELKALASKIAAAAANTAGKDLADGLYAQAQVVASAVETEFDIPDRDYFPRIERDARPEEAGGWGGLS